MKKVKCVVIVLFCLHMANGQQLNLPIINQNSRTCIDNQWRFNLGSYPDAVAPDYDDSKWRTLNLPHDWSIEPLAVQKEGISIGPFSKENIGQGRTRGGEGWYRRKLKIADYSPDKLYQLYFEGVYNETEIYLNGSKVTFNPNGYTPIVCDITKYCLSNGKENTIAVKVINSDKNSRWYTGSGIYRHVWLLSTNKLHIDNWGVNVTTSDITPERANVYVETKIINSNASGSTIRLNYQIVDQQNKIVAKSEHKATIRANSELAVKKSIVVNNPTLWSNVNPSVYSCIVSVVADGSEKDRLKTSFGIRSISFDAQKGFCINGKSVKLKGACVHHDNGFLGSAAIDRAEERKVELLVANGFNAIRCSHNPQSERFLDACDRKGVFVIEEFFDVWEKKRNESNKDYTQYFRDWCEKDIASTMKRDRNHPSIIMWSIGNEIAERFYSTGAVIAKRLRNAVKMYDTERPVTSAVNGSKKELKEKKFEVGLIPFLDIQGYNYRWKDYQEDVTMFPANLIYGAESVSKEMSENWSLINKFPNIIGDFVWTGIDYIGESGIGHVENVKEGIKINTADHWANWPYFASVCGEIDFCGDKKNVSYYRDVLWDRKNIELFVHTPIPENYVENVDFWGWPDIQKCWTWKGFENELLDVYVYTKSPLVRLYLNGILIGEKEVSEAAKYTALFKVKYMPGELKAVSIENNKEVATSIITTSGEASAIKLTAEQDTINASVNDLAFIHVEITDKNGILINNSKAKLKIEISGNATIAGAGNASQIDMESFNSATPKVYRGKALVIVRPTGQVGTAVLKVSADGLPVNVI
jgi:beta-galactosidase